MPNRLRSDISGKDLLNFFEDHDFVPERTKGSHVILARRYQEQKQVLVVPVHKTTPKGTLKAIIHQSEKYISLEVLRDFFYTK